MFFSALWWLFCVNLTYRCQDMGENVASPTLKLVLRHLPFFLSFLVVILIQFDVSLRRYGNKRCFSGLETGFTVYCVNLWALWWLFCYILPYRCKDTGENVAFSTFQPVLMHLPVFKNILVVILHQSDMPLPKYRQKRCFTCFKTGFTAFAVLFWALWWLFCVNLMYCCQDTRKNFTSPPLKVV